MDLGLLSVEITRKCNLKCSYCCRGKAENVNIDYRYIDSLLDQIDSIHSLTFTGGEPSLNVPAMQYFIDESKRKRVRIDYVLIVTNGINIKQDFIDVCIDISKIANISVYLSDDDYHTSQRLYDDSLLKVLPFYKKRSVHWKRTLVLKEGRGSSLPIYGYIPIANPFASYRCFNSRIHFFTLTAYGDVINGTEFSYDNQHKHKLCNVEDLHKFYNFLNQQKMANNRFVEENWERLSETDKMYLLEKEREIQNEWMQWEDEQKRKPAKIVVNMPVVKEGIKR